MSKLKQNKHIRAFKILLTLIFICMYFTVTPIFIVEYGMSNDVSAFDNGAQFAEVYSVFCFAWIVGHLFFGFLLFSIYMICYGCHKQTEGKA